MKELVPMNDYGIFANSKFEAMVDSRFVAEVFEKEHRNVLQAIKNILENSGFSEEFRRLNFQQSNYVNEQNHKQPCYAMTRDGFTALVMGFTGRKADQFKERYIKRFNEMEDYIEMLQTLREQYKPLTDAIKAVYESPDSHFYSNEANMLNRIVLGMTAKDFRALHNIAKNEPIRSYFTPEQSKLMSHLQCIDVGLIYSIPSYLERKQKLEWCAMKWRERKKNDR